MTAMVGEGSRPGNTFLDGDTVTAQTHVRSVSAKDVSRTFGDFEQETYGYAAGSGGCTPAVLAFIGEASACAALVAERRNGATQDRTTTYVAHQLDNEQRGADLMA